MAFKDLGAVTAYAYAVQGGYTGTEAEFRALLGNVAIDLSEIENLSVTVTTLPEGSQATASYSNGVLSLGIPRGPKGDTGEKGDKGDPGEVTEESLAETLTNYPTKEEVDEALDTKADAIIETASGSIASFDDGGDDLPMKSLKVEIVPKQSGSGDPSPDNIRPIEGWSGVNVVRTGENLFNYEDNGISYIGMAQSNGAFTNRITDTKELFQPSVQWFNGSTYVGGAYMTSSAIGRQSVVCNINSAITKIRIKHNGATQDLGVDYPFTKTGTFTVSFTITGNAPNVVGGLSFKDVQIELGSTATAYEPCQGTSKYIPFKDENGDPITVYGGEMNITEGEGESDMSTPIDLGNLTWRRDSNSGVYYFYANLPTPSAYTYNTPLAQLKVTALPYTYKGTSGWAYMPNKTFGFTYETLRIRDDDFTDATSFAESLSGVTFSYGVANPTPIYCEPTEIRTLKGVNNVWADTGDVDVEYRADTTLTFEKLKNALISLGGNI